MPKTFLDMQDEILLRANLNNHDRPFVKLEIVAAIQDLFRERRWSWAETRDVLTLNGGNTSINSGQYQLALPAVPGRIQRSWLPNAPEQVIPVPEYVPYTTEDEVVQWIRSGVDPERGYPTQYTYFGGEYLFNRSPNDDIEYEFLRWSPPSTAALADGDDIPVPDPALDAVMWKALSRIVAVHDRDMQLSQMYRAEYSEAVTQLRAIDIGSVKKLRVAMPSEYGGAYDEY